jgi:hypothetical protein
MPAQLSRLMEPLKIPPEIRADIEARELERRAREGCTIKPQTRPVRRPQRRRRVRASS